MNMKNLVRIILPLLFGGFLLGLTLIGEMGLPHLAFLVGTLIGDQLFTRS